MKRILEEWLSRFGPGDVTIHRTARAGPVVPPAARRLAFDERAITARTDDSAQAEEYRKFYEAELHRVKVSYSGSTNLDDNGDYARLDGPRVWIEFCRQGEDHYQTFWRDRLTDNGAEFSY